MIIVLVLQKMASTLISAHHFYQSGFGLFMTSNWLSWQMLNGYCRGSEQNRAPWYTATTEMVHSFRRYGAWRPHKLCTAATPLDYSDIAFSRIMDSPLMVGT